ncbi:MAG: InlB B-repeat-containing protein [Lachnospiraceae bacterium]|nr:InlB B-repeat-containing protein [Lachnospiraceae bacterium]
MKSCSLRKLWTALVAAWLVLCLVSPASAHAAAGIAAADELQAAIGSAAEGAELLVGDIDFSALSEPIVIAKSITLRSQKELGSVTFFDSTFVIDGSAGKVSVQFDNIIFYSTGDAANIEDSFWDEEKELPPAVTFRGDADVLLTGCVFRNYVSVAGANLFADYSESDAQLNIQASDCSFLGNAVRDRGGAVLLVGQADKNNVTFTADNCAFNGNFSGNREDSRGGGAIYAEAAVLKLSGCGFSANEASHQYLLPEPEDEAQAEVAGYVEYADRTKGGAIYAIESDLFMTGCTVTQCSASLGGGLALENTDFIFLNGIIARNRAASSVFRKGLEEGLKAETGFGGGLFIGADREVAADIINSSFYGNTAYNGYGGICADGADGNEMPFTVRLMLCTYADNSTLTAYSNPEVDRSKYQPEQPAETPQNEEPEETEEAAEPEQTEEAAEPEETEEAAEPEGTGNTEDSEKAEEAAKKAEEAAKKAEEAQKAADEAYEKAVAEALAKVEWTEVPGDIWNAPFVEAKASVIIDDRFSSLRRNSLSFPRHDMPDEANNYSYYAAPEVARAEGYMPNVPSAVFTHVVPEEAFREAFPLPDGMAEEIFSPYYDKVLGNYAIGDNFGGSLTYQLLVDNAVWRSVEAKSVTPDLPVPEKEGYSFDLWQTTDGSTYAGGASFITAAQPLTVQVNAVMTPNTYTLHFTSEGGTQDIQQVYGTPVTLPAASEKKNYDFVNWYKSDGTVAQDGEIYTVLGDSSYTAQYTKRFPKTAVIALSAAIAAVALYLIIARIADGSKGNKEQREAEKAEKAAKKLLEEKQKAGEEARKAQEKARKKAEEAEKAKAKEE